MSFLIKLFIVLFTVLILNNNKNVLGDAHSENLERNKRYIFPFKLPDIEYQQCTTPGGTIGHCKHFQYCNRSDLKKDNFWKIIDYFCIIEGKAIGVCCPDNSTEKSLPHFSNYLLSNDGNPIWEETDNNNHNPSVNQLEKIVTRPVDRGCGLSTKQFPKITGGHPADAGEWPWMAAVMTTGIDMPICGGVLITDRHVLTAAHCTNKYPMDEVFIRLGEYDFGHHNETRSRDFNITQIRQHVDFDSVTYENDVAVVKLHRPTLFNSYIWPICMPPSGETWEGYSAVITGWGTQFFGGPISEILMEVSVPIWNQRRCQSSFTQRVTDQFLCAGAYEGGRDSCQGDSGGPLVVQLPSKRWVIVGIVSWGVRCGEANRPGIYTRVNSYVTWIIDNSEF